ncbi:hypothetical protein PANT_22c00147 [Moesziomyces antarcticus T-34]|uniref:Mig1 protein n=1 Tax=Pseudozyma antarctica (strain T-34) TaxID=1151754 RepID=M9LSD4_PSEA3|nr:hypothetical protein PANT_22c00147 [Moesziomyces antarcticus T-34]
MIFKTISLGLSLGMCAGLAAAAGAPTTLTVNNAEYEKRCGAGSDPNYPCFTFVGGDLKDVHAEIWTMGRMFPATNFLLKDDQMRDFTIDDPNKLFSIDWRAFDVGMIYSPIDTSKACYRIQIQAPKDGTSRIWVNDGLDGEGIDLDSNTSFLGDHDFCSKWLRIHVGNDK